MNFWQFPESLHDNIAVIYKAESLTYLQLEQLVIEFMAELPEPGNLVALLCHNDLDTLVAYLACLKKRVPMILMDGQTNKSTPQEFFDSFQVCALIHGRCVERLQFQATIIDPRLAVMISTSGSTGSAKQVALSYDNLIANADAICQYLPIISDDVTITTLPFHYSYGLSVINTHLMKGACILLSDDPVTSRAFWESLETCAVSSLAGVPHTYEMLGRLGFFSKALPNIRYLTQAGGRLADKFVKAFSKAMSAQNKPFFIMYGQTEATARIAWLNPAKLPEKVGSIGTAIPGGELLLQNESLEVIKQNSVAGELVFRGPNIMLGYATDSEELKQFSPPDVLNTGDIAVRDAEGDYFIVGRIKRIVKIFGLRINLDEVEKILENQGFEAKVVGTDKRLFIALNQAGKEQDAIQYLAKTLNIHPSAMRADFVAKWPLKANQKVDYAGLLSIFDGDDLHGKPKGSH